MFNIKQITQDLTHLFFPRLCEGCHQALISQESCICISCESYLSYTGYHHESGNTTELRLAGRFPFKHATSLAYFNSENLLQHLLHRLKYKERLSIGDYLGKELGKALYKENWGIDVIVPVPLYKRKEVKRGFNQSLVIAEGIADTLHVDVVLNAVSRIRNTATQTDKNRQQRVENVRDAFAVKNEKDIIHKHVLLVDDVLTTGATIEACATALLKIEGVSVSIATVGIAV